MRILMVTTAGAGHFGPMLPFGGACRRAGHDVQVAAPRSFAAAVDRAGYRFWPCDDIPEDEYAAAHSRRMANVERLGHAAMVEIAADLAPRAILPGLLTAIDTWSPDLILREVGELGSYVAAELRGVPQVQVLIGLDRFTEQMIPTVAATVARQRESVGLDPDPAGSRLRSILSLSQLPLSYEDPSTPRLEQVHRYRDSTDGQASAAIPQWWDGSDDPLVYVTFGSVAAAVPFAAAALHTVVAALADLPARILVTIGDSGDLGEWSGLPSTVHIEKWVPQRDVLASATLMVCHGGMGTVLGGLAAGVPQVVVPQFADQPDNADRVADLGAGLRVGEFGMIAVAPPPEPEAVRSAVTRVLDEQSFRDAAEKVADEIRALPTADDAVGLFEQLVREHRAAAG